MVLTLVLATSLTASLAADPVSRAEQAFGGDRGDSPEANERVQGLLDDLTDGDNTPGEQTMREAAQSAPGQARGQGMTRAMSALGISDEQIAAHQADVMELAGLNPEGPRLLIFVSTSMPEPMLRAYALDAARVGATLAFRGVREGDDMQQFLREVVQPLVPGQLAGAIQIDPRLFEVFDVERAPTFIITRAPSMGLCDQPTVTPVEKNGHTLQHKACNGPPEGTTLARGSGAVQTAWMLEQFALAGVEPAQTMFDALGAPEYDEESDPGVNSVSSEEWSLRSEALQAEGARKLRERYAQ